MTDKEKLIEILSVPIYPRIGADPAEVVADYLMDNDVRPVVRCKDCKHFSPNNFNPENFGMCKFPGTPYSIHPTPDFYCCCGERKASDAE